jgi:hypothetical protein
MIAAHAFAYSSGVVGLVAAGLWFWASLTDVPTKLGTGWGGEIHGLSEMSAALAKVAKLNRWAAAATGLAAILQAIAQWLSP